MKVVTDDNKIESVSVGVQEDERRKTKSKLPIDCIYSITYIPRKNNIVAVKYTFFSCAITTEVGTIYTLPIRT